MRKYRRSCGCIYAIVNDSSKMLKCCSDCDMSDDSIDGQKESYFINHEMYRIIENKWIHLKNRLAGTVNTSK